MKQKNLITYDDYGFAPYLKALTVLVDKANRVYGPVLERRSKAQHIRVALTILEQWKFFFNLPSSLIDMIQKGKYDAAVRDYKKGKSLMQTSFTPVSDDKRVNKDSQLPESYRVVFEKVWVEVERICADLRETLFQLLTVASSPIDTQEKILGFLLDLDAEKDPLSAYLNKQYSFLIGKLIKIHNENMEIINGKNFIILGLAGQLTDAKILSSTGDLFASSSANLEGKEQSGDANRNKQPPIRASLPWDLKMLLTAISCVSTASFDDHFGTLYILQRR